MREPWVSSCKYDLCPQCMEDLSASFVNLRATVTERETENTKLTKLWYCYWF